MGGVLVGNDVESVAGVDGALLVVAGNDVLAEADGDALVDDVHCYLENKVTI